MTIAIGCGIDTKYKTSSALSFWFTQRGRIGKEKTKCLMFIRVFTGEDLDVGNFRPVVVEQ